MTPEVLILLTAFASCSVEMVEALTIIIAAGKTSRWRSAVAGSLVALVILALLVSIGRESLIRLLPINDLRIAVGALLMVLGLSWLRKAILRSSGHKDMHDEDLIYKAKLEELSKQNSYIDGMHADTKKFYLQQRDSVGFAVAFKGVFLEGLEVVMIVISLGSNPHYFFLAVLGALSAAVVVFSVGMLLGRQLAEVPENKMKMVVGILLSSFGIFWIGEGSKISWPGNDLSILWLIGLFSITSLVYVLVLRNPVEAKN